MTQPFTPVVPAKYTYMFTDLLTGRVMGRAPLTNVSIQNSLSSTGQFTAELNLSDPRLTNKFVLANVIQPQRSAYWVDRNGQLISGGIVWDDDYQSDTRVYSITGATFDSFADYQRIDDFLLYTNLDLNIITTRLWADLQAQSSANINMILPPEGSVLSGQMSTQEYDPSQQTFYGSAIQSLSQQQPGFDYYVSVGYDSNNNPSKTLVLGDPYAGPPTSQTNMVLRNPGNVSKFTFGTQGSQSPNDVISVGGGTGSSGLQSSYRNQARLDAGYPVIKGTTQFKDTFDQPTLDSLTRAYGQSVSNLVNTVSVDMAPNRRDTPVGSFAPGDPVRFVVAPCVRFPNGLDTYLRILSFTVQPPSGTSLEQVSMTLGPAAVS